MLKQLAASILVAVVTAGAAMAGPIEDGIAAYERGDYGLALKLWRPLAEQNDAWAQGLIGSMFLRGEGVPQDYAEAVRWFRLAANQGLAADQFDLGVMYEKGQGVPQDYAEAVKWFELAATQGFPQAQVNLGVMYEKGQGVPQDYVLGSHVAQPRRGAG